MKLRNSKLIAIGVSLLTLGLGWASTSGAVSPVDRYGADTTYAMEREYSCITGGCHETNTALMDSHSTAPMTATQVKCNACHGTHTASEVGQSKPNLTGYVGQGATGYPVPMDRCLVCHSSAPAHMQNDTGCTKCHFPHEFFSKKGP